jgi:hypothetical protein
VPRIDLPETCRRITFTEEIWEWLDLFGDLVVATKNEADLHEDFRGDTPYKRVLLHATAKDLGCLDAIYFLLRFELIHQASAHVRLLCEGLITLSYIAKDPAVRAEQFQAYADIEASELASALLEFDKNRANPKAVAGVDALRQTLKPKYDQLRPKYTFVNGRGKARAFRNWCDKTIGDQARECGDDLARLYRLVHKQMSAYVHGSAWSLRRQLAYSRAHYRAEVVHVDVATIVRAATVVWLEFAKFWRAQLGRDLARSAIEFAERLEDLDEKHFILGVGAQHETSGPSIAKQEGEKRGVTSAEAQPENPSEHSRAPSDPENLETPEMFFSSVEECIASLREVLPELRAGKIVARALGDKKRMAEAERLIAFLQDTDRIRDRFKSSATPDGSVRFTFTPEAWAKFSEWKRTRKLGRETSPGTTRSKERSG